MGSFEELAKLLDGANRIYCLDQNELFGFLRASVGDVTELNSYTWAPPENIRDPERISQDPFRPQTTDPYYAQMSPDLPFPVPTREQAEGITRPTIRFAPEDLKNPSLLLPLPAETSGATPSGAQGASSYNKEDSPENIKRYLASKRWTGETKYVTPKPADVYFRDSRMIFWILKCTSLSMDFKMSEPLLLTQIEEWNDKRECWKHPLLCMSRAKDFSSKSLASPEQFMSWDLKKDTRSIFQALSGNVRYLADVLTIVYYHHIPLLLAKKHWNRAERKFLQKWELLTVKTSTPSLIAFSSSAALHPSQPPKKPPVRTSSRAIVPPKPFVSLSTTEMKQSENVSTYNVICTLAVAHSPNTSLDGQWCRMMAYQSSHVHTVCCLVISRNHPRGQVRYFQPVPQHAASKAESAASKAESAASKSGSGASKAEPAVK